MAVNGVKVNHLYSIHLGLVGINKAKLQLRKGKGEEKRLKVICVQIHVRYLYICL